MRRVDELLPEKVLVFGYWPSRGDGPDLGIGVHRVLFPSAVVVVVFSVALVVLLRNLGLDAANSVVSLVGGLVAWVLLLMGVRYYGWYELDSDGRPVRFVSHLRPSSLSGRTGMLPWMFHRRRRRL